MIFHKRNKITVDAFTDQEHISTYPIDRSNKHLPEWYQKMKPTVGHTCPQGLTGKTSTFKMCHGFQDHVNTSFTFPLWADLMFKVNIDNTFVYQYPNKHCNFGMESHNSVESTPMAEFAPKRHIKLFSPWLLKEKTGVNFYWSQAFWSYGAAASEVLVPPGVVNYKYQNGTHINLMVEPGKQVDLDAGTPMVYLHPLTEKKVEIKTHVVDTKEYQKVKASTVSNKFIGGYKSFKRKQNAPTLD